MSVPNQSILVTGGAGYIGSHTVLTLLNQGHRVRVLDKFVSSEAILGPLQGSYPDRLEIWQDDLADKARLTQAMKGIDKVIHCASSKSVPLSFSDPLGFYEQNVAITIALLQTMLAENVKQLVFCSSASVYQSQEGVISEKSPLDPQSPYGFSKLACERIIEDTCQAYPDFKAINCRLFNPVGYHPSLWQHRHIFDAQAVWPQMMLAVEQNRPFKLFGTDYPTKDGTAVRDFVHIDDMALGLAKAATSLGQLDESYYLVNLGSGSPITLLESLSAFKKVVESQGHTLTIEHHLRREGDIVFSHSDCSHAKECLGWEPRATLEQMSRSCWQ